MSTYREIPDAEIAVGQPIDQALIQTLKENIDAQFDGEVTSPQISPLALARSAPVAGGRMIYQLTRLHESDNTTLMRIFFRVAGTYRVRLESHNLDSFSSDSEDGAALTNDAGRSNDYSGRLDKIAASDGSSTRIGTLTNNVSPGNSNSSNTHAELDVDHTFAVGDELQVDIDVGGAAPVGHTTIKIATGDYDGLFGVNVYGKIT